MNALPGVRCWLAMGCASLFAAGLLGAEESRLVNVSARAPVGAGAAVLTGGFVVGPGDERTVLVRAVGPTLGAAPFALAGVLMDPVLKLFAASPSGGVAAENDNWNSADESVFAAVGAFPLQPGSKDAAMVTTLKPGAYTAQVTANGDATGAEIVLLEIYEVGRFGARLINVSTRGRVGRGASILIPGVTVSAGDLPRKLLVRASGGALRALGVLDTLADPIVAVVGTDGEILASNDNREAPATAHSANGATLTAAFRRAGAFEFARGSRDAAVLVELSAGNYGIQVSGAGESTGVVLAEVFDVTGFVARDTVRILAPQNAADESGLQRAHFTIARTGALVSDLRVHYEISGSATSGTDYAQLPGYVVLPAGADRVEIPIVPQADSATERAETVTLTLLPNENYQLAAPSAATLWLVDGLHAFLESARARHGLPGMAAAVFDSDRLIAIGAAGTRKLGSGVPLLHTDKLQTASIAKTMTATVVAHLVEAGLLRWESTLAEIYPELAAAMDARLREVTVDLLLRHLGGLPQWMRNDTIVKEWTRRYAHLDNTGKRYEAVKYIVTHPPQHTPGTVHYYTNDSFLLLGHICERATGLTWEALIAKYLFGPLDMASAGFGDPSNDRSSHHPWGHVKNRGQFVPFDPDPAGFGQVPFGSSYGSILHASVGDLAKYGIFHLRGDLGLENRLAAATFRRLHHAPLTPRQPLPERFSAGFFNEGELRPDGRWVNVQHWGYYARGRTLFWFSPQANVGAVILTNGTDEDPVAGMRPLSEVVIELFKRYRSTPLAERTNGP